MTVTSVPSDNYTIHVQGNVGATPCWTNNDSLQVPAQRQDPDRDAEPGLRDDHARVAERYSSRR